MKRIDYSLKEDYKSPCLRIIETKTEFSFLQSNTEPIIDGGEEDWD